MPRHICVNVFGTRPPKRMSKTQGKEIEKLQKLSLYVCVCVCVCVRANACPMDAPLSVLCLTWHRPLGFHFPPTRPHSYCPPPLRWPMDGATGYRTPRLFPHVHSGLQCPTLAPPLPRSAGPVQMGLDHSLYTRPPVPLGFPAPPWLHPARAFRPPMGLGCRPPPPLFPLVFLAPPWLHPARAFRPPIGLGCRLPPAPLGSPCPTLAPPCAGLQAPNGSWLQTSPSVPPGFPCPTLAPPCAGLQAPNGSWLQTPPPLFPLVPLAPPWRRPCAGLQAVNGLIWVPGSLGMSGIARGKQIKRYSRLSGSNLDAARPAEEVHSGRVTHTHTDTDTHTHTHTHTHTETWPRTHTHTHAYWHAHVLACTWKRAFQCIGWIGLLGA